MARKAAPKINRQVGATICLALRAGAPLQAALELVGLKRETFDDWLRDRKFGGEVKAAEASARVKAVGSIVMAGREDWRASAWYLQRVAQDQELARLKELTTDS